MLERCCACQGRLWNRFEVLAVWRQKHEYMDITACLGEADGRRIPKMGVCIFSRAFPPSIGGLERVAELLACHLADSGCDVEVVTDTAGTRDDTGYPFRATRTRSLGGRLGCIAATEATPFAGAFSRA